MTHSETLVLLQTWQRTITAADRQLDALAAVTGGRADSPLSDAVHSIECAYTTALGAQIGDRDEWLQWFRWENQMGRRCHTAKAARWKKDRRITTLKHLAALIRDSP